LYFACRDRPHRPDRRLGFFARYDILQAYHADRRAVVLSFVHLLRGYRTVSVSVRQKKLCFMMSRQRMIRILVLGLCKPQSLVQTPCRNQPPRSALGTQAVKPDPASLKLLRG